MPLVVLPRQANLTEPGWGCALRRCGDRYLSRTGSILFRGFQVRTRRDFERFVSEFGSPPSEVERALLAPAGFIHARTHGGAWPLRLWVHGGSTAGRQQQLVLADGRDVLRLLPKRLCARLVDRGLAQVLPHPVTGDLLWFHPPQSFTAVPGLALEAAVLEELRAVLAEVEVAVALECGDVLMLDNLLVSHEQRVAHQPGAALCADPCFLLGADSARWVEAARAACSEIQGAAPASPGQPCLG